MGISVSILLIAAGAILKWAVTASTSGINLQTVGMILCIVGIVGLVENARLFWDQGCRSVLGPALLDVVMLAGGCGGEAVAGGAGFDDVGFVGDSVDDGGGETGVGEGFCPF
jgi:Domain of unknown function (DUF6458)